MVTGDLPCGKILGCSGFIFRPTWMTSHFRVAVWFGSRRSPVMRSSFASELHWRWQAGQDAIAAHRSQIFTFWEDEAETRMAISDHLEQVQGLRLWKKSIP